MVGKNQIVTFWDKQRAAIRALKVEKEIPKAITLFQEALALNPNHMESVYYLGMCFLSDGKYDKAMKSFEKLIQIEPSSHRGYKELGKLHARRAVSANDLEIAMKYLQKSYDLNRSETGTPLLLAEIELLYGRIESAREHLSQIVRTNTRSVGGFFLLGYISWKWGIGGDHAKILNEAKVAREGKLKSKKTTSSEGAVKKKMYQDTTLFSQFWENWNSGIQNYSRVFYPLDNYLNQKRKSLDLAVPDY
jgi:tetratricopeptide (TPR) repeat protein